MLYVSHATSASNMVATFAGRVAGGEGGVPLLDRLEIHKFNVSVKCRFRGALGRTTPCVLGVWQACASVKTCLTLSERQHIRCTRVTHQIQQKVQTDPEKRTSRHFYDLLCSLKSECQGEFGICFHLKHENEVRFCP